MDQFQYFWPTVFLGIFGILAWGCRGIYSARARMVALKNAGLPIAPRWSWIFGNLALAFGNENVPKRATRILLFSEVVSQFTKTGACYIDLWPFGRPFLLIMSPSLATQACQNFPQIAEDKPRELSEFFKPLAGGSNLFDLPAVPWKHWRAVFNKGFNNEAVNFMVPEMVRQCARYRDILINKASEGKLVQLDKVTLRFTIDFIGQASLNSPMRAQEGYDELADSMLNQVSWIEKAQGSNPLEHINFVRKFMHWRNGQRMDKAIGSHIDARFKELASSRGEEESKSIMDLVLKSYLQDSKSASATVTMDPEFRSFAIRQIRLFLFVGHDSMSSTICYAFHLLSKNPSTLSKLREEHESVFGPRLSSLASSITTNPSLLNQLPYTNAVLRETLRLFPPGSGMRNGARGLSLTGEDGTRYPTNGCIIWVLHAAMHRAPEYWPEPDEFLPERWLVEPGHRLYPMKGAWRPFEWGPRGCIGQALAMAELKIVLVMLGRTLDFEPGYEEWDRLYGKGGKGEGVQTWRGERAFQIEEAAAHPADFYPCRLKLTDEGRNYL